MVTVVSNYCQLSQTQLSQTFAEKFTVTEVIEQRESNSDSAPYTLLKNYADRFKKYSAEEQYEIDFQHRLANRNCYLDKYGDANINHYYRNLEIKHSQPKNRASGKRVS